MLPRMHPGRLAPLPSLLPNPLLSFPFSRRPLHSSTTTESADSFDNFSHELAIVR